MELNSEVLFDDWIYLQKCLKYERLRITHGENYTDEQEKKQLLVKMDQLYQTYYQKQLEVRYKLKELEFQSQNQLLQYQLITESQKFLGEIFHYCEHMILQIRSTPQLFYFLSSFLKQKTPEVQSLVETIGNSLFVDLVHPENIEHQFLSVINQLIENEIKAIPKNQGHVSNILKSNFLLDRLLYLYTRRKNQRKYMKLVFKKHLRDLLIDQEDLKDIELDPLKIYEEILNIRQRHSVPTITELPKQRKSFFSKKNKQRESQIIKSPPTLQEALKQDEVWFRIERNSQIIQGHCRLMLQELYSNITTMPYGIRGICRKMVESIQKEVPDTLPSQIFKLIGNFLFYSWWIPAIFDPVHHDLLHNFIVKNDTKKYLLKVVNVFKHIYNDTRFAEKGCHFLNLFIESQVEQMRDFFRQLMRMQNETQSNRTSIRAFYRTMSEISEMDMSQQVNPFANNSKTQKHIEHMNQMSRFKIHSVMVSLDDLKFLSRLFHQNEPLLLERGWKDIARYAKNIQHAVQKNSIKQTQVKTYLYFTKKEWGESFMESSYLSTFNKAPTFRNKNLSGVDEKLLCKITETLRNLLISLDMSIFFDPNKEWTLSDIVEFVIQFSYLFQTKRQSGNTIPIKLLAQFLSTYLPKIPNFYTQYSFRELYFQLMFDTENRFQNIRKDANKNKKILLLAINFIEQHLKDIKQELQIQQSVKRKLTFQKFIKQHKVPACILQKKEIDIVYLQVLSMQECPHSRIAYANDLIRGRPNNTNQTEKHVQFIDEFFQVFVKKNQVVTCCDHQDDPYRVGDAFFSYIDLVRQELIRNSAPEASIETTIEEVERYLTSSMYRIIFPSRPSVNDTRLYYKTCELAWIKPQHLDISPEQRNQDMWKFAIQQLNFINDEKTPAGKLNCLEKCMNIIVNVLSLVSSGSGVGADDSLPIIIYVVIKAQPQRLFSNLNYISKFRHPNKMIGLMGFVFQQFQSAAAYIESIDETSLTVDPEVYRESCMFSSEHK